MSIKFTNIFEATDYKYFLCFIFASHRYLRAGKNILSRNRIGSFEKFIREHRRKDKSEET